MAAKPVKQQIVIDFDTQTKGLEEAEKLLTKLVSEGKINNTNMNSYKSLLSDIRKVLGSMNAAKVAGITTDELNKAQKALQSITGSLATISLNEKAMVKDGVKYTDTFEQIAEKIDDATKALEQQKTKLKELRKEKNLLDSNEGKQQIANKALQAHRTNADGTAKKGAYSKAETMLRNNSLIDIKKIKEDSPDYQVAQEAIKIYKEYVDKLNDSYDLLSKQVATATQELEQLEQLMIETGSKEAGEAIEEQAKKMSELSSATKEQVKAAKENNQEVLQQGDSFNKTDGAIVKATKSFIKYNMVINFVKQALKQAIKTVVELDSSITGMAMVTGKSRKELYSMIPTLNKLAQATSSTITEVANLTTEYTRQGRTLQDSITLAEQTARAAKIAGISTAESIQYMTAAINGFSLKAENAVQVSDVFAKLAANSATTYEDLAVSLSKVSSQAYAAGMSMEYTTAILAKGISTTQEAPESIGTALKTILARAKELSSYGSTLEDNTSLNKVDNALKAVGISLRNTNGEFRNMEDIFNELGPKWDEFTTMQRQSIAQAIAGTRQQTRFLAIMQDWDETQRLIAISQNAAGASLYQYNKYAESLQASITNLTTAWQGFIQNLANNEVIKKIIDMATDVLNTLSNISNALGDIPSATLLIVAALSTVGTAMAKIKQHSIERKAMAGLITKEEAKIAIEESKQFNILRSIVGQVKEIFKYKKQGVLEDKKSVELSKLKDKSLKAESKQNKKSWKDKIKEIREDQKARKKSNTFLKQEAKQLKAKKGFIASVSQLNKKDLDIIESNTKKQAVAALLQKDQINLSEKAKLLSEQTVLSEDKKIAIEAMEGKAKEHLNDLTSETTFNTQQEVLALKQKLLDEGEVTDEKEAELRAAEMILDADKKDQRTLGQKAKDGIKNLAIKAQELALSIGTAIATIASAVASTIGIPGAIAAAAVLAGAGLAAVSVSASAAAKKDKQEKIKEGNNTIYENSQKRDTINEVYDEYKQLNNKKIRTAEEQKRMKEIEAQLAEMDSKAFGGKSNQGLLDAMDAYKTQLDQEDKEANDKSMQALTDMQNDDNVLLAQIADTLKNVWEALSSWFGKIDWKRVGLGILTGGMSEVYGLVGKGLTNLGNTLYKTFDPEGYANKRREQAKQILNDENNQQALKNNVNIKYKEQLAAQGIDINSKEGQNRLSAMNDAFGAIDWDKVADLHYDDYTEYMSTTFISEIGQANDILYAELEDDKTNLAKQVDAYNNALESIGDGIAKEVFANMNETYKAIAGSKDEIQALLDEGFTSEGILDYAETLRQLNFSESQIKEKLGGLKGLSEIDANGDASKYKDYMNDLYAKRSQYDNEYKALEEKLKTASGEEANQIRAQMSKITEDKKTTTSEINATNKLMYGDESTGDMRTRVKSQQSTINDIRDTIASGGKLTQDQQETMKSMFGDIYSSEEFQSSLKKGGVQAQIALSQATEEANKKTLDNFSLRKADLEAQLANATDEETKKELLAELQFVNDSIEDIKDYGIEYEKVNKAVLKREKIDNEINKINKEMSESNADALKGYQKINDLLLDKQRIQKEELERAKKLALEYTGLAEEELENYITIDEATGAVIVNYEAINALEEDGTEKGKIMAKAIMDQVNGLSEAASTYAEIGDAIKENSKAQEEFLINQQNKGIELMKARLEAEYNATKESLDKRKSLYEKYFNSLNEEENEANYETDRQALLNKIAKLSTATDASSLAALKEAQKQLNSLDDDYNKSQREARQQAVMDSIDAESEALDNAYDDAMKNVQGLWEEFCSMQQEDQMALFRQYGDSFQEVTDLQKKVAEEELDGYMKSLATLTGIDYSSNTSNLTDAGANSNTYVPPTSKSSTTDGVNDTAGMANNGNTTNNNTNNLDISFSVDGAQDTETIKKAIMDALSEVLSEYGLSPNVNN